MNAYYACCLALLAGVGGCGSDGGDDPAAPSPCATMIGQYDACEGICECKPKKGVKPFVEENQVTNECDQTYQITVEGDTLTIIDDPVAAGLSATLSEDGSELAWANGAIWTRSCGQ